MYVSLWLQGLKTSLMLYRLVLAFGGLQVSKYSNKPIKRILQHIAGATKLGDLARYILICAFCIDGIGDSKGVVVCGE